MKNNIKKPLNTLNDIDKKILPFFSSPIILKRISDQKKNIDFKHQKKLIYKIIKLNEKLVKFTTWIKKYNFNLDSFYGYSAAPNLKARDKSGYLSALAGEDGVEEINKRTATEFILFIRNNLYYNLKFRLSNILYKIEKFIPLFKSHTLLNNIYLFVPNRLLKPQPYIRFSYRIMQINNYFKKRKDGVLHSPLLKAVELKGELDIEQNNLNNLLLRTKFSSILPASEKKTTIAERALRKEGNRPSSRQGLHPSEQQDLALKTNPILRSLNRRLEASPKVLIKINNYNDQSNYDYSIIQLHKFENGRSIKYILLKLKNLLNEIENLINIKNKLIKITSINKFLSSNFAISKLSTPKNSNLLVDTTVESKAQIETSNSQNTLIMQPLNESTLQRTNLNGEVPSSSLFKEVERSTQVDNSNAPQDPHSNQSVKNLRLKIKKINSYNNNIENIETSPFLVEDGMVKENIIKIENNIKSVIPTAEQYPFRLMSTSELKVNIGENAKIFNVEKDIINENSNPVDLLYFNNNINKPVINQYLKSMSTYNMITNGTILYYSNIIGFNFKKRIRAYLPFIKSIPPVLSYPKGLEVSFAERENNNSKFIISGRNGERLTSPYTFRGLKKVVGSLDKGKFSVFGRGIENNKLINNIYKFLYLSFKSMYCLISKPVFIIKSNKIIIQLFYFLLIPKIFKHIKSKTNYKSRNKKKIYQDFVEKKKKQAFANLFQARLKEKEDALKVKYFATMPLQLLEQILGERSISRKGATPYTEQSFKGEKVNSSNSSTMNIDKKSAQFLRNNYNKELLELRKKEEEKSGVKFDKFGRVIFKSLENKLIQKQKGFAKNKNFKFINRNYHDNQIKKGLKFYKLFFKRFEFNDNDLHILRIPRKWANLLPMITAGNNYQEAQVKRDELRYPYPKQAPSHTQPIKSGGTKDTRPKQLIQGRRPKLFKFLALTYLNIFKFKVSHPLLNRLKFKLKWFQKELIKDKSILFSLSSKNMLQSRELLRRNSGANSDIFLTKDTLALSALGKGGNKDKLLVGNVGSAGRNKFNSYNNFNWFLFKKLFWSISLSKKIIPNAKILQKLGIPQWSWPYIGIKKKGYASYLSLNKKIRGNVPYVRQEERPIFKYSWPFSLLMSPTIIQINKKVNQYTLNSNFNSSDLYQVQSDESLSLPLPTEKNILRKEESTVIRSNAQNKKLNKIRELYTKRYHLMKLANINLIKIYPLKFEKLCEVLNSIFNKPVELDLIRLHYPYHDSNILVRLLAFMINKMKLRRITRRLFNKAVVKSIKKINNKDQVNIIPAFLSGMTIKVAGRLMKYRVIPRKTVKIVRRGSSSIGKINYSDISKYTNKNKRGSFTITIKAGQNFFN